MKRYAIITEKKPREIVLLRGSGCRYAKCVFCDYHSDSCPDEKKNFELNREVLKHVTGVYGELEVINSGSVFELDDKTLDLIKRICLKKKINVVHFESHFMYREQIGQLRLDFQPITLKMKVGVETFDRDFREKVLFKGIPNHSPQSIASGFEEANLLFGLKGQTVQSMLSDIQTGLANFERICVNIMCKNSTPVVPDKQVIADFMLGVYPHYKDNPRVDILLTNTAFGVGD